MKKIPAAELINHLKDHNSDEPDVFQKYEESYSWDGCGIFSHWLEADGSYPNGHQLSPFKDDGDPKLFKDY